MLLKTMIINLLYWLHIIFCLVSILYYMNMDWLMVIRIE